MPIARESENVESTFEKYPTPIEASVAQSMGQRSMARYGSATRKIARASRNQRVQCGSVRLKLCSPSTNHCTAVQMVCMMKYGSRMSVTIRASVACQVGSPSRSTR